MSAKLHNMVKVTGQVPEELHGKAVQVATKNRTTIGALVSFGLRLALTALKDDPAALAKIAPDKRRAAAEVR